MPTYAYYCGFPEHPKGTPREFVVAMPTIPETVPETAPCEACGKQAKRDRMREWKSQNTVGMTPISRSNALGHDLTFAFGRKPLMDGISHGDEAPFRDTGELDKFLNGKNKLGNPVLDDKGEPMRNKNGTVIRKGAKLYQIAPGATPSHSANPPRRGTAYRVGNTVLEAGFVDAKEALGGGTSGGLDKDRIINGE